MTDWLPPQFNFVPMTSFKHMVTPTNNWIISHVGGLHPWCSGWHAYHESTGLGMNPDLGR